MENTVYKTAALEKFTELELEKIGELAKSVIRYSVSLYHLLNRQPMSKRLESSLLNTIELLEEDLLPDIASELFARRNA